MKKIQCNFRLPADLAEKLARAADETGVSQTQLLEELLAEHLNEKVRKHAENARRKAEAALERMRRKGTRE